MRPSAPTLATPPPTVGSASGAVDHYEQELVEELRRATLGDYEILTQLGQGGMATVYLAHDIQLDRKVAIKVMSPALLTGQGMVERFKLEARTAAKLSHPHIIPIYAVKEVGKMLFFIMKFVEGRPLDSIIKELDKLPLPMMMTIITKVGEALGYAHRNGVVHRDIKPANIMIDVEGLPMVTDFGIAKVADQQGLTMTGATIGTPTYMSPEQCAAGQITGASDQYSLGILSYEMLTGTPPFHADSLMTIMYMHCNDEPPEVTELRADCPPPLREAVLRMLAKAPEDRWPSMEDMVAAIGGATTLAFNDPIRTQLVGLAMAGESHKAIQRISTPRSPMPLMGKGQSVQASHAATVKMSTDATAAEGTTTKKGGSKLWLGVGATVIAGVAIGLGILQPWAPNGETGEPVTGGGTPPVGVMPVVAAPVVRLDVTPPSATLQPNGTLQFTAQPLDSTGAQATVAVTWSTDNSAIATVSETGAVTARSAGNATITASAGDVSRTVSITVNAPVPPPVTGGGRPTPVASVRINGAREQVEVGITFQLRAGALDAAGNTLSGRNFTWISSNASVASVDGAGQVTAQTPGNARITATSERQSLSVSLLVLPEAVARVSLSPSQVNPLAVDGAVTLRATAVGSRGVGLQGREEQWRSSNTTVATVQNGVVRAMGAGQTEISVSIEGQRASVDIVVETAAVQPVLNPRDAVTEVVKRYEQALQLKDFTAVREVFPTLPTDAENGLRTFLEPYRNLQVQIEIDQINLAGEMANVTGQQRYFDGPATGKPVVEGPLTLILRRGSDGVWRITETR